MALLQDIMTRNVITVSPQQSVQEAADMMSQYNIGFVPVVQNGQSIGIITDRDITLRVTAKGHSPQATKIESVMSRDVVTATPHMEIHEAANLMAQKQIRRLPVVDNNNRLCGVVALGDLAVKETYQGEAGEALSIISEPSAPQM